MQSSGAQVPAASWACPELAEGLVLSLPKGLSKPRWALNGGRLGALMQVSMGAQEQGGAKSGYREQVRRGNERLA